MTRFTVGCVPYVNAIPLVAMFEEMGDVSPVHVMYDVPSRLPSLLADGTAQAILVSSIAALREPNLPVADGVCIGSRGSVKSVRLFSRVPFGQIQTLALDSSSMTSNRLALILLDEIYGVQPTTLVAEPKQDLMLQEADACILIGDNGMTAPGTGLHVLDLGAAWLELTGLPFVWAVWLGRSDLDPELAWWLNRAAACVTPQAAGGEVEVVAANRAYMIQKAMQQANWTKGMAEDYFNSVMVYDLGEDMKAGLRAYRDRLPECAANWPNFVAQRVPTA